MFTVTYRINDNFTTIRGRSMKVLVERAKSTIWQFGWDNPQKLQVFAIAGFNGSEKLFEAESFPFCISSFNVTEEMAKWVVEVNYWYCGRPNTCII